MKLEHEGSGMLFRQRDVDPLLKSEMTLFDHSEQR